MRYPLSEKEIFEFRPKPFYFITTSDKSALTYEETKQSLTELKEGGFGGIVLFNKPPKGFTPDQYLTDDWFDMVKCFCKVAKELGLVIWLNDGFDYPPGSVAGKIEKIDPTLKQLHLEANTEGKVKVLEADWGYPAFENPKSSELFIELVYERYLKEVGEYFGNTIVGFFSDADNRRVLPPSMFNKNHPSYNYFPWAVNFEERFTAKYGYDIKPYLKDIFARRDIPQAVDYWEFAGQLYQSWFKNNYAWQKAHGLMYTGHTSDSAPFLFDQTCRSSCFTEGRFSDIQSNFDFPGTDHELFAEDGGRHMRVADWYTQTHVWGLPLTKTKMPGFADVSHETRVKQAASTAHMYGKKGVMCEMFAATNFGASPSDLRRISAFQIMQGVTFVVPHAYHHKFFGPAKYFAPPDFSRHSLHDYSINQFNDEMSTRCCMMAKGKLIAPIALLDPASAVWRNNFNNTEYFKTFTALNRLPYGFIICDIDKVVNGDLGFKVAVLSGFDLTDEEKTALEKKGIILINGDELDKLSAIITDCDVCYEGEGTPFIIRKDIDGEEFTFISNPEGYEPIRGTIKAYGRAKELIIYPGDIYYISKNYDDIPDVPQNGELYCTLPDTLKVNFCSPNNILMERFEVNGEGVEKTAEVNEFDFVFQSTIEDEIKLYVPEFAQEKIDEIIFNGDKLTNATNTLVFDEKYYVYSVQTKTGENVIKIKKHDTFHFSERIYLEGNFDVDIQANYDEYKLSIRVYNAKTFIPKDAKVTISSRRNTLSINKSWALQGQAFYSGKCEYIADLDINTDGRYRIVLPEVTAVLNTYVDGKNLGQLFHAPYSYEVELVKGVHELKFEVVNTYGNALEGYAEESGITKGIYVEKL